MSRDLTAVTDSLERLGLWYAQDTDADPQPYPQRGHLALDVKAVCDAAVLLTRQRDALAAELDKAAPYVRGIHTSAWILTNRVGGAS